MMFLLGASPFRPLTSSLIIPALYFAILFEAGHLNHEVKDFEADQGNELRTNAVVFGKKRVFVASSLLFLLSYPLFYGMVAAGHVGAYAVPLSLFLLLLHMLSFIQTLRAGISRQAVLRYRKAYRTIYFVLWAASFLPLMLPGVKAGSSAL
jgi:4-hydroxybenzoate polyprenyltransferase